MRRSTRRGIFFNLDGILADSGIRVFDQPARMVAAAEHLVRHSEANRTQALPACRERELR